MENNYKIYKITNTINEKIYVGQTNKKIEERFAQHINNALKGCNFHLSKALRKYGIDNFKIEEIKNNLSSEEANFYEMFYISKLKSSERNIGYNMTPGGEGGNTYLTKSEEEMEIIKEKISIANSGGHNGNAHNFKMKNINTNKIFHFGSSTECCKWFLENENISKSRIGLRNLKLAKNFGLQDAYLGKYIFSEEKEEFSNYTLIKSAKGSRPYKIINLDTKEEYYTFGLKPAMKHFSVGEKVIHNKKRFLIMELKNE